MKCGWNLKTLGAALLVTSVLTLLLVPSTSAAGKYKVLYTFTGGADGWFPAAGLILDSSGNLYGTTVGGGPDNLGTVFELTLAGDGSWTRKLLYSFARPRDGYSPEAGLIFDPAGNLYGTTADGGRANEGTVFRLTPNSDGSWSEKVLYSFCSLSKCRDGSGPYGGLVLDRSGNLYGTTLANDVYGSGVVFQLTPNPDGSWSESVLHQFTGGMDGGEPRAGLIFDSSGNLYGTTLAGGNRSQCGGNGCGVVFKLTPSGNGRWKEQVLRRTTRGGDGSQPYAGLIFDSSGNLYGTTFAGGNLAHCSGFGCGVVFKLTPSGNGRWKEQVLHRFTGGRDGSQPLAGLTVDGAGNLYGTTALGGNVSGCGCGVVFRLTPNSDDSWRESEIHSFVGHPGSLPTAGVAFDTAGNLYGTTRGDGSQTFGSVFEITP